MISIILLFLLLFYGIAIIKKLAKVVVGMSIVIISIILLIAISGIAIIKHSDVPTRVSEINLEYNELCRKLDYFELNEEQNQKIIKEVEKWNERVSYIKRRANSLWTGIFVPKEVSDAFKYIYINQGENNEQN